ncbi:DNA polymerase epsilon catalytic subunit B [Bienertia sinuspersici]
MEGLWRLSTPFHSPWDLKDINVRQAGPWIIMGDMNCVINMEERIGSNVRQSEMALARHYFEVCGLLDIPYGGQYFTWSNKQMAEDRANVVYLPEGGVRPLPNHPAII